MDPKKVGQTIAHLRKQAGFTQKGLADRLCISDKAVSKWERGLSVPDIAYLGRLSVLLDADIDTILEGKHISRADCWRGLLISDCKNTEVSLLTMVYDKPLVYYLLSNFLLAGICEVMIVCTEAEEASLHGLIGNGEALGVSLRYQTNCGIYDVICHNRDFFTDCDIMTVFAQSVLHSASLTYLFQRAMLNKSQHTILAVPTVNPANKKNRLIFDETKRVVGQGAVVTQYNYCALPVLFSSSSLLLQDIDCDVELGDLINHLAKRGSLYVETANRGIMDIPIETFEDVLDASNMVRILQNCTGNYLACLEEIAWRRGFMNAQMLQNAQIKYAETQYGNYLLQLSKE